MKQKYLVLILLILIGLMIRLSYDLYVTDQQALQSMQQEQQSSQQQIADLNDRLVALARQQPSLSFMGTGLSTQLADSQHAAQQLQIQMQRAELKQVHQQWLKSSLELAQQTLDQGKIDTTLVMLQQIQTHTLDSQRQDADPLNLALLQAIHNDQQQLKQARDRDQVTLNTMARSLELIQQQLLRFSDLPPTLVAASTSEEKKHILPKLSKIISIERVEPTTQQQMLTRSLLCKQASFSLGLARAAILENNNAAVGFYLQNAAQLIKPITDANITSVSSQIVKLQTRQLPKPIGLTSLALVSSSKSKVS